MNADGLTWVSMLKTPQGKGVNKPENSGSCVILCFMKISITVAINEYNIEQLVPSCLCPNSFKDSNHKNNHIIGHFPKCILAGYFSSVKKYIAMEL